MEGVGSRLGRASSRYGPAPVFSGPVRKWKKQWVHVSSSRSYSRSNNNAPSLLLCRWTPISSTLSGDNSVKPEEPPRRKFRYTPIVVLDEKKKEVAKRTNDEPVAGKTYQSSPKATTESDGIFRKQDIDSLFLEEGQASNINCVAPDRSNKRFVDMDLCLEGDGDNPTSDGENEVDTRGRQAR